jgi:hypothetical protein
VLTIYTKLASAFSEKQVCKFSVYFSDGFYADSPVNFGELVLDPDGFEINSLNGNEKLNSGRFKWLEVPYFGPKTMSMKIAAEMYAEWCKSNNVEVDPYSTAGMSVSPNAAKQTAGYVFTIPNPENPSEQIDRWIQIFVGEPGEGRGPWPKNLMASVLGYFWDECANENPNFPVDKWRNLAAAFIEEEKWLEGMDSFDFDRVTNLGLRHWG